MPPAVSVIQQTTDQDNTDNDDTPFHEWQSYQQNMDIEQGATRELSFRVLLHPGACLGRRAMLLILLHIMLIYFFLLILLY